MTHALPPGPKGRPWVGNALQFRRDRLGFLTDLASTYGPVAYFRVGRTPMYFFSQPEVVRLLLVDREDEFTNREVIANLRLLLGEVLVPTDGLSPRRLISTCCGCVQEQAVLASDGAPHHRLRRALAPGFRPDQLRRYHDLMVDLTGQVLDRLAAGSPSGPAATVDMALESRRIALLIAARTLFGLDLTGDEDRLLDAFTYLSRKATSPLTAVDNLPIRLPFTPYRRYLRAVQLIESTAQAAIARAREVDPGDSLLAHLVQNPLTDDEPLTLPEIRDQVLQLFDAGHSTTSSALAWCLYLLDRHPDVMAKVAQELAAVVPDGRPSHADLPRLQYLDQVIREALRLYPPIWGQARYSHKDFDFGGYRVPAGSFVLVSQWVTQRLPELFPDPDRFDPDRFAPGTSTVPYAYFPFGGGYHACLGNIYAIQEAKVVLAMMLSRFRPRLVPGHPVEPVIRSMTLQPRLGLPMRLERTGTPVAAKR